MPLVEKPVRKTPVDEPSHAVKATWQVPRIRTGHLFESNSLACGKSSQFVEQCLQNPTTS